MAFKNVTRAFFFRVVVHYTFNFLWQSMRISCPRFLLLTQPSLLNCRLRATFPTKHISLYPQFSRAAKMSDTAKAPVLDPYFSLSRKDPLICSVTGEMVSKT